MEQLGHFDGIVPSQGTIYRALLQFIWQQSLFQDLIKGHLQIESVIAMNIIIQ